MYRCEYAFKLNKKIRKNYLFSMKVLMIYISICVFMIKMYTFSLKCL